MNKRLKFLISLLLILAMTVSVFAVPASSFTHDVATSTADLLLINTDTDTTVFTQNANKMRFAGNLAELMTFLLAVENIPQPQTETYTVEQSFISSLPYSDGCLAPYVGQTITVKDLMAVMLYTSGNDAAYALADIVTNGRRDTFVRMMNLKAGELGCTRTGFVSPGYDSSKNHYTTCNDLYKLYSAVKKIDLYNSIMSGGTYTFDGYVEGDDAYSLTSEASIFNADSPYYFRFVNDAKFSYTRETYAGIVLTTTYRGKTYFFAGLLGLNTSERNVFSDARKLTTWAYLNLSEHKVFNADDVISKATVNTGWGEYSVSLYPFNSAYKMLPNDVDESKLSYTFDVPDSLSIPLRAGQTIGSAQLTYDGEDIDTVDLIVVSEEGLGMLSDSARFANYVLGRLMPNEPPTEAPATTAPSAQTPEEETLLARGEAETVMEAGE